MRKGYLGIGALLAFALAGSAANAAVVYSQNFELGLGDARWSGAGSVQSTGGLGAFLGTYHLRNDGTSASILTVDGLATHTSLTLTFDLAMWDSIDYHDTNLDIFQVSVDSTFLYNGPLGNYWGNPINTYGNSIGPGTPLTPDFTAYMSPDYGYGSFRDSVRHVTYTFDHSVSSAEIKFQYPNSQGGFDESFGIDNVTVSSNAVPGDVNGDGSVDVVDLLYLVDAFGSLTGDANYDVRCDFNNDGGVDVVDLLIFVENFGT